MSITYRLVQTVKRVLRFLRIMRRPTAPVVYYSRSTPPSRFREPGDLWVDLSSNALYRLDRGKWTTIRVA